MILPPQAVAYNRDEFVRRKYRILNLLAEMFESADWLILHTPFIYTAGITKSVTLCDVRRARSELFVLDYIYIYIV